MVALSSLTDVTITSLTAGDILQSPNGTTWVNIQPGVGSGIQPYSAFTSLTNVAETRSAQIDMANHFILNAQLQDYAEVKVDVTALATTNLDISTGNFFNLAQAVDITTLNFLNPAATGKSCAFTIHRTKDAAGGVARTIVWPASVKWEGGAAPTLSTGASAVDTIEFFTIDNGTTWYGFISGLNMF